MRRELPGGFELDDDAMRIDVDAVHAFLSQHAYWAKGRSRERQEDLIAASQRVVGLYHEGQIGFSRTLSDGAIAYLADVYVLPAYRGRGLGVELVGESVERGPYAACKWLLHTDDAHSLYEQFGFGPPGPRLMERPARRR